MGLAEQFTNLGEDFVASFNERVNFLGQNIVETKRLLSNTPKLLNKFRNEHKVMGKKLRADLGIFVDNLTDNVGKILNKFQKEQKIIHQDVIRAHKSWENVTKFMAAKRKNFNGSLAKAKQSAAHTH
jgi:hypothetical protein